jgi:glycosyltransferase involved in cell wall biosynthesis
VNGVPAPPGGSSGFHGVIEDIALAAAHCQVRVGLVALPSETVFRNRLGLPRRAWEISRAALQHAALTRLVREGSDSDIVVLREFLTLPFLGVAPRLLRYRQRLVLTLTHNLQQAHQRLSHRFALRALSRAGFGFCCLESPAGFAGLVSPLPAAAPLVLPHVIREAAGCAPAARGSRPCIGVVGVPRPEKNTADVFTRLVLLRDSGALDAELLLGCTDPLLLRLWADRVDQVVDTRGRSDYEEALRRSDVLVFAYSEPRYWLRSSAVVTDAVAHGCAVVCPDFPVLRAQVTSPRCVGALFQSPEELAPAIERALAIRREDPEAFCAYRLARSPRAIAQQLDRYAEARGATA